MSLSLRTLVAARMLARFAGDERGNALTEYALVAGLIALAAVASVGRLGNTVSACLNNFMQRVAPYWPQ